MNKNTPLARAVRTFLAAISGYALVWMGIEWSQDWRVGGVLITLNIVSALVTALAAYLLALRGWTAATAWGKAVAQFGQFVGAGLGTLVLNELTEVAVLNFGRGLLTLVVSGIFSALTTMGLNFSEDSPPGPPPP